MNNTNGFERQISELKKHGLLNTIKVIDSPIDSEIKVDGKKVLNFCSNNYLGLANNPRLISAVKKAVDKYGVGPAAVRTISGTTKLHVELEQALKKFKKAEDVITYQSGFCANIAVIPAVVSENDYILSDELNHASIIDGCRLSKATVIRYTHCNPKDLEDKIKELKSKPVRSKTKSRMLIITDGVFSMDGDIAPLAELLKVAKKHNCLLMVDDAHGEGVLGKNGRGIVDHFNLHGQVDLEIGTMSKAFGVVGGFAAGKKEIIDWLRQRSRPFLFSSAVTIPDIAACLESVRILGKSDKLVKKLWKNGEYFKEKMSKLGFDIGKSETPITPVMLTDEKLTQKLSQRLLELGILATAIKYPTVPLGKPRIRVMLSAAHTQKHLDQAVKAFEKAGKELKII